MHQCVCRTFIKFVIVHAESSSPFININIYTKDAADNLHVCDNLASIICRMSTQTSDLNTIYPCDKKRVYIGSWEANNT